MLKFKLIFRILITIVLTISLLGFKASKGAKKKARKPASLPYESIAAEYSSSSSIFQSFRIHFSPFANFISFTVPSARHLRSGDTLKTVYLDCYASEESRSWTCLSGCEGGELRLSFNNNVQINRIRIEPFEDFIPRACDGSESESDQKISSNRTMTFNLTGVKVLR